MEHLYRKLKEYANTGYYPFHMPGHKRNTALIGSELPYELDITEIDGFDDLHHSEGILKELQEYAACVYHAEETHYLVNGSTVGLLSAVMGSTNSGDCILMARNCHKAVYHAVELSELKTEYLYPSITKEGIQGSIHPKDVEEALKKHPDLLFRDAFFFYHFFQSLRIITYVLVFSKLVHNVPDRAVIIHSDQRRSVCIRFMISHLDLLILNAV